MLEIPETAFQLYLAATFLLACHCFVSNVHCFVSNVFIWCSSKLFEHYMHMYMSINRITLAIYVHIAI